MTTAARRARKKFNARYGEKSMAKRAAKAEAALARMEAAIAELEEVDDFLGGPLPKPVVGDVVETNQGEGGVTTS